MEEQRVKIDKILLRKKKEKIFSLLDTNSYY